MLRHRDDIIRIAESYGFNHVRIFGSVARGDADPDSDVDLAVDLINQKRLQTTILDKIGGKQDVEEILGVDVDFITETSLRPRIRMSATREAINL